MIPAGAAAEGGVLARDHRRLAAIVSADVVGYSLLMGRDDSATLAGLKAHRRELIDPKISEYGGRIVKTTGDGLLLEFPSVVDALRCTVDVQRGMAERNAGVPPEQRIEFRIGINVGDIIIDGEDIYGDGVNVAARLQTLAEPGGVCVSRVVRDQVLDKLSFAFEDLGSREVKNIARPVELYRVEFGSGVPQTTGPGRRRWQLRLTGRPAPAILVGLVLVLGYFVADRFWLTKHHAVTEPEPTTKVPQGRPPASGAVTVRDRSIAVLPFVDMSEKHDQEYFADGMTEEILDLLSRIPDLHVPARTSSFYFKGKRATILDIANALNVAHVLEGSVRKSGNILRITVQLVRADGDYHLWSETYDRRLDDVFKIQDEIAAAVVRALKISLLEGSLPRATTTQSTEAYTLYLQARSMFSRANTQAESERAVAYMQRALKLDPAFAPAWALLSRAHSFLAQAYIYGPHEWDEARRAAEQALAMDPKLPDAHNAMAKVQYVYEWNWVGAQAQLQQALALDPGSPWGLTLAGNLARSMGHTDRSLELIQRSVANDPINSDRYYDLALALYFAGKLDEALVAIRKSLDLNPAASWSHYLAGKVVLAKGDPKAALAEMDRESDEQSRLSGGALAYYALGRNGDADAALANLEKRYSGENAFGIAQVHAYRGEIDRAFSWLERALRQHDSNLPFDIRGEPLLKNLWPDSRYKAFLRRMNLPETLEQRETTHEARLHHPVGYRGD
jgi:adenylate cyclase